MPSLDCLSYPQTPRQQGCFFSTELRCCCFVLLILLQLLALLELLLSETGTVTTPRLACPRLRPRLLLSLPTPSPARPASPLSCLSRFNYQTMTFS